VRPPHESLTSRATASRPSGVKGGRIGTPFSATPIARRALRQCGRPARGRRATVPVKCCARTAVASAAYAAASSAEDTGNTPEGVSIGSPLPWKNVRASRVVALKRAAGHTSAPSTRGSSDGM
jgi:hypothetical protein